MTSSPDRLSERTLIDEAPIGIFQADKNGNYTDVNPAGCEMVGYTREELLEMSISDLAPDDTNPEAIPHFAELKRSGHSRSEGTLVHKEGHSVEVILDAVVLDETHFVAYVQEITERKEYERKVERARTELRRVIDLIPDPLFAKNRDGKLLLANEAYAEAVGSTLDQVEGQLEPDIFPDTDDYEKLRQRDIELIESGESSVFEEHVTRADGEEHTYQTTRIPFSPTEGDEDAVLGYARDVTDLKEYEQELEEQRNNLEILNQVVRHDIRNKLQVVLTYADLLQTEVGEAEQERVEQVLEAARDAVTITTTARDVMEVMLQSDVEYTPVRLDTVLENKVEEIRSNYDSALVTLDGPLPTVEVMADDILPSVFRNLLTNAIQHNDKAIPEVTLSATRDDGRVSVRIADNGPGIPDDHKEDIFEQGEMGLDSDGTGLGLHLVDTLVDHYDGEVRVEDNDPDGAIFIVELPIEDEG